MLSAVFTPLGIVLGSVAQDTFMQLRRNGEQEDLESIYIPGLPHQMLFGGQFALVFQQMNQFQVDTRLIQSLRQLQLQRSNWDDPEDFLDALQDTLESNRNMIGILAFYQHTEQGMMPRVYQLHGDDMQLINVNDNGQPVYSLFYMEQDAILGRLFRGSKQVNGDKVEEIPPLQPRADIYSLDKAQDITRFLHQTHWYASHLDGAMTSQMPAIEMLTITPDKITI